jgi:hypothetical protein
MDQAKDNLAARTQIQAAFESGRRLGERKDRVDGRLQRATIGETSDFNRSNFSGDAVPTTYAPRPRAS